MELEHEFGRELARPEPCKSIFDVEGVMDVNFQCARSCKDSRTSIVERQTSCRLSSYRRLRMTQR